MQLICCNCLFIFTLRHFPVERIAIITNIMYQYTTLANEVGMEIRNLEVVDGNRFLKALVGDIFDGTLGAVGKPDGHARMEGACLDPAQAFHIEGMFRGGIDGLQLALGVSMVTWVISSVVLTKVRTTSL